MAVPGISTTDNAFIIYVLDSALQSQIDEIIQVSYQVNASKKCLHVQRKADIIRL